MTRSQHDLIATQFVVSLTAAAGIALLIGLLAVIVLTGRTSPPKRGVQACTHLLSAINTFNYRTPSLTAGELETWATPSLAQAFVVSPHMTPGMVAGKWQVTPTVKAFNTTSPVRVEVTSTLPGVGTVTTHWLCQTDHGLVTALEPGR